MRPYLRKTPVFTEDFYSLSLVTEGDEVVEIGGKACRARRGMVLCSAPGEVWSFRGGITLKALNIAFDRQFLLDFFADSHFLEHFSYFSASKESPFMQLDDDLYSCILTLYKDMQHEIKAYKDKNLHLLRALLYQTLILLSRAEVRKPEEVSPHTASAPNRFVERFRVLVEDNFVSQSGTKFYADSLFITQNYLNKVIRQALGVPPKAYITARRMQEACQQLRYTMLSVQEIAQWLGFETATYFIRSFRKHIGKTPLEYRKEYQRSQEK